MEIRVDQRNVRKPDVFSYCPVGEAVITTAGKLDAKFVIHTVGPVWNNGESNEEEKLNNCYMNTLNLANQYPIKSIAFPNISTGIYKFPKKKAAEIAISSLKKFIESNNSSITNIQFVCFDDENYQIYLETVQGIVEKMKWGFQYN